MLPHNEVIHSNWDVFGNKSLKVRGGTGIFTGRLPLVFFTNMPSNSGMVQNLQYITTQYKDGVVVPETSDLKALDQFKGGMITDVNKLVQKLHEIDPKKFPLEITPDAGAVPSSAAGVDRNFKMPQVWKTSQAELPAMFLPSLLLSLQPLLQLPSSYQI